MREKCVQTLEVNKHLLTCRNIRKQIISIKIDHENDFREFVETFNIRSIAEMSKGGTVFYTINDLLDRCDLLCLSEREEAIMTLGKVNIELNKVDTYRLIG